MGEIRLIIQTNSGEATDERLIVDSKALEAVFRLDTVSGNVGVISGRQAAMIMRTLDKRYYRNFTIHSEVKKGVCDYVQ